MMRVFTARWEHETAMPRTESDYYQDLELQEGLCLLTEQGTR